MTNFQQDGPMRFGGQRGIANYEENTRGSQFDEMPAERGGFTSFPEQMQEQKMRLRAVTFGDHFSQATLFWASRSEPEKEHIVEAFLFELGKLTLQSVQERMVGMLANVNGELAELVALGFGRAVPARGQVNNEIGRTSGLSQLEGLPAPVKGRMVAVLAADGVNIDELMAMAKVLDKAGVKAEVIAPHGGFLAGNNGTDPLQVDKTLLTAGSILYDAVNIPGGKMSVNALAANREAPHFVQEAYKHCRAICATSEGPLFLSLSICSPS